MAMNKHLMDLLLKLRDTFIILVEKLECVRQSLLLVHAEALHGGAAHA